MPEKLRERIEEFGAPEISDVDCRYLAKVKQSMAGLIGVSILLAVWVAGQALDGDPAGQLFTFLCVFGGAYEAVVRMRLYKESCGKAFCAWAKSLAIGAFFQLATFFVMIIFGWVVNFGDYQNAAGTFAMPKTTA